jgi:hypothetical protein
VKVTDPQVPLDLVTPKLSKETPFQAERYTSHFVPIVGAVANEKVKAP